MNKLDWLLPWRAKRLLSEQEQRASEALQHLQKLTDQLADLNEERRILLDKIEQDKNSCQEQLSKIMADFKADHDQLNTALNQAYENNKYVLGQKFGLLDDEREALTKRAVDAETELKTQTANFKAEQRKVAAMTRWIKVAHRLDVPSTDNAIERILKEHQGSISAIVVFILFLFSNISFAQQPPILRTFFDTNPAPIVDVVAGVGIMVTPSTPNIQTRRFTVDATGSTVASNVYGSNVIGMVGSATNAINATNWIGSDALSNQIFLAMTNLNTYTSNQIHVDITNLNTYTSNALQQGMTNLNVVTSNSLQQSMSNTVGYVSNILYYSSTNFFQQNQYTTNFFRGFVVEPGGVLKGDVLCDQGAGLGLNNGDTFVALASDENQDLLPVIGVAGENAPAGSYVTVVNVGDVWMDTSSFANGDYVYLNSLGKIDTYPTSANAVVIEIGMIAYAHNPGILRVRINPKYQGVGFTHQILGNLEYVLWSTVGNPDSGAQFVTRNGQSIAMFGINSAAAPAEANSQIINNSGIPMLFQANSNTMVTISTSSNLSVGWFGKLSGNGMGLTNLLGAIQSFQGKGTNITIYGDVNVTNAMLIGAFGEILSNANGIVKIAGGNITNSGFITSTNGIFMVTVTNDVAPPPNVLQPIGLFGSMMMSNVTNTITVGSSGVYRTLTNYQTIRTNGFVAVPGFNGGFLTNNIAGYYKIFYYASFIPGNSDMIEIEVNVNGTGREEIAGFGQFDTPARVRTVAGGGILYLPAKSSVCLQFNNRSAANNISVWRAGLTVGTP